jgi:aminomuconate-semialdehyde/2-hydroxymuconate-6-semialdehyde dehydrogenase
MRIRNFVDGRFVESGRVFEKVHPADGLIVAEVFEAVRDTVDEAVEAGRRALDGPWGKLSVRDRAAVLDRIADRIEARFDEFLECHSLDFYSELNNICVKL